MYVIADTPEKAAEGCMFMLKQNEQTYDTPEIVKVEEYKKPEDVNETTGPTLN